MIQHSTEESGFTLVELMMVLAILSILTTMAMVSHRHFVEKARAVEAEVALAEVDRLETLYHANHGTYADDFAAIGFALSSTLKHYKVTIQLENGGASFRATAVPLQKTNLPMALVLTHSKEGTTLQRADLRILAEQGGGSTTSIGASHADQGGRGGSAGAEASPTKTSCRQGGEATVAEDGLLDMNFCLR